VDWNSLPDLIAFAALAVVFSSLLPRKPDSSVRLWLAAWILIVVHFGAKFADASGSAVIPSLIEGGTLVFAALAFMWAAVSRRMTWQGFWFFAALGIPQLAYNGLAVFDGIPAAYYLAVTVLGFALPAFAIARLVPRRSDRVLAIGACAALAVSLLLVIRYNSDPSNGANNVLTWLYLCAGILQWRRARSMSTGTVTTIVGFFAWASVFPIGFAMDTWLPHVHIDDACYNIPKYIVAIGIILTLLEEQMERSNFLAHHDELTGLPNRRLLLDRLGSAIERARRAGSTIALLTIDLNGFKTVNDSYGHNAGDELLRVVARRFSGRLRSIDTCARFGGDEFLVLADQLDTRADAECLVRDLLETLEEPVEIGGASTRAKASIGIAMFPEDGSDAEALLACSDARMYAAKRGPLSHGRRVETRAVS
jgi:diguanylate cyclase (GGDEF)-like protein